MAERWSRGTDGPVRLVRRLARPGRTATRSRPTASRAASATARWASGSGRTCPPKTPRRAAEVDGLAVTGPPTGRTPTPARSRRCAPGRRRRSPARRSSASMPEPRRSRWNRSADSSTSKFVCAATRSMRLPRTRIGAVVVALDDEARRAIASMRWTTTPVGSGGSARSSIDGRSSAIRARSRVESLARRRRRSRRRRGPRASRASRNGRPGIAGRRQVHLVEGDEHRLVEQRRVVGAQLVADDVVVPDRVARRAVDDVDEDPGPLDVAQERVAETGPPTRRPRSGPGTSAIVGRRSSSSPRSITPRFGSRVVNG